MMTAVFYPRAFVCALLILSTHGFPTKNSKSQDQSSAAYTDGHSVSHRERPGGHHASMSYSPAGDVPMVGQVPSSSQFVYTNPASGNVLSGTLPAGYVPVVPVQPGYAGSAQASPSGIKWAVAPNLFKEGLANNEVLSSNDVSSSTELAAQSTPSGPVLQSGETSSVLKEAELGNFKRETEEVGYPVDHMGAGPGFSLDSLASPVVPYVGPWVYPTLYAYPLPYPYPQFDYRLLYGLYPPGIYTTFNKQHENGKDHYQNIHYLKEHGSGPDSAGSPGQQKKFTYGA